jgi:hypothetical protein
MLRKLLGGGDPEATTSSSYWESPVHLGFWLLGLMGVFQRSNVS